MTHLEHWNEQVEEYVLISNTCKVYLHAKNCFKND